MALPGIEPGSRASEAQILSVVLQDHCRTPNISNKTTALVQFELKFNSSIKNGFYFFFCLTKRNKSQERTPYFVLHALKVCPLIAIKQNFAPFVHTCRTITNVCANLYNSIPLNMSKNLKFYYF